MEELICYVDFEENLNEASQIEKSINDMDLDFIHDYMNEYISSEYYLDIEF